MSDPRHRQPDPEFLDCTCIACGDEFHVIRAISHLISTTHCLSCAEEILTLEGWFNSPEEASSSTEAL